MTKKEVLANKKAYNARKRELLANGYRICRVRDNWESLIRKYDEEITLFKGWMTQKW